MIYQHNKHNHETTLQTGAVLCGINIFSYRDNITVLRCELGYCYFDRSTGWNDLT